MKRRILALICALALLFSLSAAARAASGEDLETALERTAQYCINAVPSPGEGAHWLITALSAGDFDLPEGYLDAYYQAMDRAAEESKGVLSKNKYTEYSRTIIGITAAGYDAADVAGYDLTAPLGDYDATRRQGINGPVYALLALDSGDYPCQVRDKYVEFILSRQLDDGGWAFSGKVSDPDMTAMALQALSSYTERADVAEALERAVERLSLLQKEDGSFASFGVVSVESTAQVILALCELGISLDDPRFVKNGNTLLSDLLSYQKKDGSFSHEKEGKVNGVATEQALLAMVAAQRQRDGHKGVYDMDDRYEKPRFADTRGHWAEESILFCVDSGLFQGTGERQFSPEQPMTRAMLVTVLWRMAGKPAADGADIFSDVADSAYYAEAIRWASKNGITQGYEDGSFGVNDNVTRQQLALFLRRFAANEKLDVSAAADLSGYGDASAVADWAAEALAWANAEGLVTGSTGDLLLPGNDATRAQVAVILKRFVEDLT